MNSIAGSNGKVLRGGNLNDAVNAAGIESMPPYLPQHTKFVRWGKNNRYWLTRIGDGYCFGDMSTDSKSQWWPRGNKLAQVKYRNSELRPAENKRALLQQKISCFLTDEWPLLAQPSPKHRYLQAKGIPPLEVRQIQNDLVVPLRDEHGILWSVQHINAQGDKRLFKGSRKKGCFSLIGDMRSSEVLFLAEGYATAISLHVATGLPAAMAVDAGNIIHVAGAIRKVRPDLHIVIAADNDQWGERNVGLLKAAEAAFQHRCLLVSPQFPDALISELRAKNAPLPTDWNDLHQLLGTDEMQRQLSPHLQFSKE